ncbi:MAG: hypothetical protein H6813_00135 [Phycisphaeraceae bacterium]|nr:hypothetical protein [Phycisphaeraceae bacterium]MCB9847506.1 hypothetical protein [Phycisphaeraceae bacterium]
MFKLLRKYDKWILAIGGSLLMVVFLLPQALQQFGANPRKSAIANTDDGTIIEQDRIDAQQELGILESISPLIINSMLQLGYNPDGAEDSDLNIAMHWLLLTREAKRNGLVGGAQDGRGFLAVAARFLARQYVLQNRFQLDFNQLPDIEAQVRQTFAMQLEQARSKAINNGFPPLMIDRTLAKARGVLRMYDAYLAFDLPAMQESMELCHRYFDGAEIVWYTVGSEALIDPAYEPDENEVLIQYASHKEDLPGEGEYGFGYRAEDRVRLEWLRISRQEVSDAVFVDPVEANTLWRANRSRYTGEFAQERARVETDIRNERTDAILRDAEQLVRAELLKARGGLVQGANGRYELPPDWDEIKPKFIVIAQRIGAQLRAKYGSDMPNPSALDDSRQWRTRSETRGIPVVGNASRLIGPRNVSIVDLAFSTPEIDPESSYQVQTGVAYGPLQAATTGDVIFFRVIEAAPSAPRSLDEARADVVQDLRKLRAFEALQAEAPRMINQIMTLGAVKAAEDRGVTLLKGVTVKRERIEPIDPVSSPPTFEIVKIDTDDFRNAVMDRAESFAINEPLNRLPEKDLLLSIPLKSRREIAIVGITNRIPLTIEAFRMVEAEALQYDRTRQFNINALAAWPYSTSQMQLRHGVEIIRQRSEEDEEATEESAPMVLDPGRIQG